MFVTREGTERGLFIFIVDKNEVYMKELGEYLRQARIHNGVSVTEACEDLDFSTSQLENIESGNVKAFKDIYELKDSVKLYAKYLGLDSDKVVDEFNGFLFQHTSRISLDDIVMAQQMKENEEKKVKSPYTMEYKEKKNIWPFIGALIVLILIIGIFYLVITHIHHPSNRVDELKSVESEEKFYEFT